MAQTKIGWRPYVATTTPTESTLWTSIYSVYNADAVGSSSLKTSLFAAYNGESNANDSFGTNNGTAVGGLTYSTGKIGNAFVFNGSNAYVSLPNDSLNSLTSDFSISFWVSFTSLSGGQAIISNLAYSYPNQWGIAVYAYGPNLVFDISIGTNNEPLRLGTTYSQSMSINTNYFYTITRKGSTRSRIYRDGTLLVSNTNTVNPVNNAGNMRPTIGAINYGPLYSNIKDYYLSNGSKIDELNIWNKELTQSEITELYNSGNGAQYITDSFYKPTTNDALNTYNGTAQGGLTYGVGKVGTAFQFNGTNSYVSLPNNSLNFTGNFSISMWVKFSSSSLSQILISNFTIGGATTVSGWFIEKTDNAELRFRGYNNGSLVLNATKIAFSPSTSVYTHLVVSRSATNSKIYINGVLDITSTVTAAPNYESTNYPMIGANRYNSTTYQEFFNGNIDGVNIWQKELTQSEITELYNSGNGKQYPN